MSIISETLSFIFILTFIVITNGESCARDEKSKCNFGQKYLYHQNTNKYGRKEAITWKQAEKQCIEKHGTHLASIHTHHDYKISKDLCLTQGGTGAAKCWIGLSKDDGKDFQWVDKTLYKNETHYWWWAQSEPSSIHKNHTGEDCAYIAADKLGFWNDFNCSGIGDSQNNIIVSQYLCYNPEFDENKSCVCECDRCYVWGDPHFHTFDNFHHHYQGECVYKYVSKCHDYSNVDVPFEIIGSHKKCFKNGVSCINEIYVRLYNNDGSLAFNIRLSEKFAAFFVGDGPLTLGRQYKYNNDLSWFEAGIASGQLEFKVFTGKSNVDKIYSDIRIRLKKILDQTGFASIWVAQCWKGKLCGLCGYYDGISNNDLKLPNGSIIPPVKAMQQIVKINRNGWEATTKFGNSWIDNRYENGQTKCQQNIDLVVNAPSTECNQEAVAAMCENAFSTYCNRQCNREKLNKIHDEWIDSCIFDSCSICNNTINFSNINSTTSLRCAASSIAVCKIYCNETITLTPKPTTLSPTLMPTTAPSPSPTKLPTSSPTPNPSMRPTRNPTPSPTNLPTTTPSPPPTSSPTHSPTTSPTVAPTLSPSPLPTKKPSKNPTKTPTFRPSKFPSKSPSKSPTHSPTPAPTNLPTNSPTRSPSHNPTSSPTPSPTHIPTSSPTPSPTNLPTNAPTSAPTNSPTPSPTSLPTNAPTPAPTSAPTLSPSKAPTSHPTYDDCGLSFKVDFMMMMDNSCGLNQEHCGKQNNFASNIVQKVHDAFNSRFSLIKYNAFAETLFDFNSNINNKENMRLMYALIRNQDCILSKITDPSTAMKKTIEMYKKINHTNRTRTVVMINNCKDSSSDSKDDKDEKNVCALKNELVSNKIDIIVVNVGKSIPCDAYSCLPDTKKKVHCIPEWNQYNFKTVMNKIVKEMCSPPTSAPTHSPTPAPTRSPTFNPTREPTQKIWWKKPWYPAPPIVEKKKSSSSSSTNKRLWWRK